jgi:hypothetical protein
MVKVRSRQAVQGFRWECGNRRPLPGSCASPRTGLVRQNPFLQRFAEFCHPRSFRHSKPHRRPWGLASSSLLAPAPALLPRTCRRLRFVRHLLPRPGLSLDPADLTNVAVLWHRGDDFEKGGTRVPLVFRLATADDRRPPDKKPSRYLWKQGGGGQVCVCVWWGGGGVQETHGTTEMMIPRVAAKIGTKCPVVYAK